MVFHNDTLWQQDFRKANRVYDEGNPYDFVRFRSWNTEHLLICCVKRFMPWVRNIFVILARESQKQDWMDDEGVKVVYHRDFIPERFLPTFNSCAIEMFVYRIPGLSEYFLYGNDDMFPVAPLTEKDFFEDGVPCLHHGEKPFPQNPNIFHLFCRSGQRFVAKEFGVDCSRILIRGGHSITPMLKSTWEYLWHRGSADIEASITPFRDGMNFCQWIAPCWHYLAGNYIDRVPERTYVSTNNPVEDVAKAIATCNGIVCVNDNECEKDYMKYGRTVAEAIQRKLKEQ